MEKRAYITEKNHPVKSYSFNIKNKKISVFSARIRVVLRVLRKFFSVPYMVILVLQFLSRFIWHCKLEPRLNTSTVCFNRPLSIERAVKNITCKLFSKTAFVKINSREIFYKRSFAKISTLKINFFKLL